MNFKLVAEKINRILNGVDSEIIALGFQNPTDFDFNVQATGFHLDHIKNEKKGVNFIPVFISSMGGTRNPVPDLKQANYTIPITFYFPVRFKDKLFLLDDFLADCFVGRRLNYGTDEAPVRCVSNISVPQFGEIQELDVLKEFASWTEKLYQRQLEVMEPYISMQITLYLSNASEDIIYGNDVTSELSLEISSCASAWVINKIYYKGDYVVYNDKLYRCNVNESREYEFNASDWVEVNSTTNVIFASGSLQSNSQSVSEQEIGTSEARSLPIGTSYGVSFSANIKKDEFYTFLLNKWFDGTIQELRINANLNLDGLEFQRRCFISSLNMPIVKGEPLTITFTFVKAVDEESE